MKYSVVLLFLSLFSCVTDRMINKDDMPNPTGIAPGMIVVNEIVAKGSVNANEFGTTEDWFELYNTTNQTIEMEAGKWFVTDAAGSNNRKYELPAITLAPKGYLVIWCDGLNMVATQIHTNFNLSAAGEDVGLYFDQDGTDIAIDVKSYPAMTVDGQSIGRQPDGSANWIFFSFPTPGSSNN